MPSKSRNLRRKIFRNRSSKYKDILKRKKKSEIVQWGSRTTSKPVNPTEAGIMEIPHIWQTGDRYYKLASQYYNNPEYWWIIATYNQKPTEGHLTLGDVILIPTPIERLLEIYNK